MSAYTRASSTTVAGYITSCPGAHLLAGSLAAQRGNGHLFVTVTLEHLISGEGATLLTVGGVGGVGGCTYTCTNLRLFGVFSGSGVPDGVHVQDVHLLEENQESVVASW